MIELLLVFLIIGILAATGATLLLRYGVDGKLTEGKQMAGALWTALQTSAMAQCGTAVPVTNVYARAGLTNAGQMEPDRWSVSTGATNTLSVDCTLGVFTASASPLFVVKGDGDDVSSLRVHLVYSSAGAPPSKLQCSKDAGTTFVDC